jgi:HprK-related kinase A
VWDPERLRDALRAEGLALDLGAVRIRVRSDLPALVPALQSVYSEFEPESPHGVFDATVCLRRVCGPRRWIQPQIELVTDGERVFEPFPHDAHLPLLEWGLNYLIATRCNQHLLLHAGIVERAGIGVVLPALPGSGKSTLTAALACAGYRLLSDEFGVVDLQRGTLLPLVRPIGLKNDSVALVRELAPRGAIGPLFPQTRKGDVAHLRPAAEAVRQRACCVEPRIVVFPCFERGARTTLQRVAPSRAFAKLSVNSFNYRLLGPRGFDAIARIAANCSLHQLVFGDLKSAVALVDGLVERLKAPQQLEAVA